MAVPGSLVYVGLAILVTAAAGQDHYDLKRVAGVGDLAIVEIDSQPSINDSGQISFIGKVHQPNGAPDAYNIFIVGANGTLMNITPGLGSDLSRTLTGPTQINNPGQVVVRQVIYQPTPFGLAPFSYLETWNANAPGLRTVRWASNPLGTTEIDAIFPYGSINNSNGVIFPFLDNGGNFLATDTSAGRFRVQVNGVLPKPFLGDNNRSVMNLFGNWIAVLQPAFFPIITVAQNGYTALGAFPGFNDPGTAVAYAGIPTGGQAGVYVAFEAPANTFTTSIRVCGLAHNGILEMGETFEDLNHNGVFDASIGEVDLSPVQSIDLDTRVAINNIGASTTDFWIVFAGLDERGVRALFAERVQLANGVVNVLSLSRVVSVNDRIADLPGSITALSISDPLNRSGNIAAGVYTTSTSGVIRADPCSGVEVLDFNDVRFRDQSIPLVPRLEIGGKAVRGLIADGVTRVLLRSAVYPMPGILEFRAEDDEGSGLSENAGTLRDESSGREAESLLAVELIESPQPGSGRYRAFVTLKAPKDFVRGDHQAEDAMRGRHDPRRLTIKTRYYPHFGDPLPECVSVTELHRPPVVLIHGLEGYPSDFDFAMQRDSRFLTYAADYHTTHAQRFVENRFVPQIAIARIMEQLRSVDHVAGTQADVIGHSMGGLLTRLYMLNEFTWNQATFATGALRDDNYQAGDVHKLITINTPHFGSQISDILVTQTGELTQLGKLANCLADGPNSDNPALDRRCTTCGAVADLRTDSSILSTINGTSVSVPVHSIVGVGGRDDPTFIENGLGLLSNIFCNGLRFPYSAYIARSVSGIGQCGQLTPSGLFHGENDMVVSRHSQLGGLSGSAASYFSGDESWHYPIVHYDATNRVSNEVVRLLNESTDGSSFAPGYPATGNTNEPGAPDCPYIVFADAGIPAFVHPAPETMFRPGDAVSVSVNVSSTMHIYPVEAVVFGVPQLGIEIRDIAPPYEVSFAIPITFAGKLTLTAEPDFDVPGLDLLTWEINCRSSIDVNVQPNTDIQRLITPPGTSPIQFAYGDESQTVPFIAEYGLGFTGTITAPAAEVQGVTFSTDNASIATIDSRGRLSAKRIGRTIARATAGMASAAVDVVVRSVKGDRNQDGETNGTDATELALHFTGPRERTNYLAAAYSFQQAFDFDLDSDIDCDDYAEFRRRWTASQPAPASPPCNGVCPFITTQVEDLSGCIAGESTFVVRASAGSNPEYYWFHDGVYLTDGPTGSGSLISGSATESLTISQIRVSDIGDYLVKVVTPCGMKESRLATLSICAGDFNCDGGIDGSDIAAFFELWENGDGAADVNTDGGVDGTDVTEFFAHWENGC